ncbi:hypothetical protein [Agrococcus citreus]|uniref:Uncharacterized protein n=1 Tax=Agrococcus citreus TaxID=84643 RepID=A0ABP4JDA5_9MICO
MATRARDEFSAKIRHEQRLAESSRRARIQYGIVTIVWAVLVLAMVWFMVAFEAPHVLLLLVLASGLVTTWYLGSRFGGNHWQLLGHERVVADATHNLRDFDADPRPAKDLRCRQEAAAVLNGLSSVLYPQPGRGAADCAEQVQRTAKRILAAEDRNEWHNAAANEHRAELQRLLTPKRAGDA